MSLDCIDPQYSSWLRKIVEEPIPESVGGQEMCDVWEARQHWNSCPACRHEFPALQTVIERMGLKVETTIRTYLSKMKDEFLDHKRSLLSTGKDIQTAYADIIARLAGEQESLYVGELRAALLARHSQDEDASLPTLENCDEFISSLEPDVQEFVLAVVFSGDLLDWEKVDSGHDPSLSLQQWWEDYLQRIQTAIANCGLRADSLYRTIELAVSRYASLLRDRQQLQMVSSQTVALPQERIALLQSVLQEWRSESKRDFDNLQDSLKAGQMQLVRLYEHNSRRATDYEPDIVAQLGSSLYSKLQESTQRGLQVAEYLYHDRSEPNYFHGPVMLMVLAFENELILRVVWPFVTELLASGVQTYDTQGRSKYLLIIAGRFPKRSMTLGNVSWYLKEDPFMRDKVSALGFDVEAIAKDAATVNDLRNKAAHELFCELARADDLRQRIFCRDGILRPPTSRKGSRHTVGGPRVYGSAEAILIFRCGISALWRVKWHDCTRATPLNAPVSMLWLTRNEF